MQNHKNYNPWPQILVNCLPRASRGSDVIGARALQSFACYGGCWNVGSWSDSVLQHGSTQPKAHTIAFEVEQNNQKMADNNAKRAMEFMAQAEKKQKSPSGFLSGLFGG